MKKVERIGSIIYIEFDYFEIVIYSTGVQITCDRDDVKETIDIDRSEFIELLLELDK